MTALAVIDPQIAFTDPTGAYARARGAEQWEPIRRAVTSIQLFNEQLSPTAARAWVRSEYQPCQFAACGPLADLCIATSPECEFDPQLHPPPGAVVVTKHDTNAMTATAFRTWLAELDKRGTVQVTIAGFSLTTCVLVTAQGTARVLRGTGISVAVPRDLVGARSGLYTSAGSPSPVEEALMLLEAEGIDTAPTSRK
jgi:nicotinamidase-related amidase